MKYLPRTMEPIIKEASRQFKVVLLSGMRQSGKTTLLKHVADDKRKFITLDNASAERITNNPPLFFKEHPAPAAINEIQLTSNAFGSIKAAVDRSEDRGQYWLTGSRRYAYMKGATGSLAGRMLEFRFLPLSIYEREGLGLEQKPYVPTEEVFSSKRPLNRKSEEETWKVIFQGGWPKVCSRNARPRPAMKALVDTYIEKDVRAICHLDNVLVFERFLRALAMCSGRELEFNVLANMTGVAHQTIKRWLTIAVATNLIWLVYPLPPHLGKVDRQLVKRPKIYMVDAGLLAYLLNIKSAKELSAHPNADKIFETFVVMEIIKSWIHNGHHQDFYYWRDSQGCEIDLIVKDSKLSCIQIEPTAYPDEHTTKWIRKIRSFGFPMDTSSIVCMVDQPHYLGRGIIAHSIWDI